MAAAVASRSSPALHTMSVPGPSSAASPPQSAHSLSAPSPQQQQQKLTFALAQIHGDVCLVQVPHPSAHAQGAMSAALMAADVHVFRHEFITLFRYSHRAALHPADVHILEPIDDTATLYEEDKGTVFIARDVMTRMQRFAMAARRSAYAPQQRYHAHSHSHYAHYAQAHVQRARHGHSMSVSLPIVAAPARMRS